MLIVEDGTGIVGAHSYATVAQADTYHLLMGNEGWPQPPAPTTEDPTPEDPNSSKKEAALRRGSMYLDAIYGSRVLGVRKNPAQGLIFPQLGIVYWDGRPVDENSVPIIWQNAAIEVALLAYTGVQLAATVAAGEQELVSKKIDVLEWQWAQGTKKQTASLGWLDIMLASLFGPPTDEDAMLFGRIVRA